MTNETLKPQEQTLKPEVTIQANFSNFDETQIEAVMAPRKALLESIKPEITLKNYYALEEKILVEEKRLKDILDLKRGKQSRMAKYTFILNPSYFEQEFMQ